jgi:hypothetical protein
VKANDERSYLKGGQRDGKVTWWDVVKGTDESIIRLFVVSEAPGDMYICKLYFTREANVGGKAAL